MSSSSTWKVGSTARVAVPKHAKLMRRAVICTLDENKASVLWEAWHPKPLPCQPCYIASPTLEKPASSPSKSWLGWTDEEDTELEVSLNQLVPLLDFEKDHALPEAAKPLERKPTKLEKSQALRWKDRGDQLLKLGDGAAALPYYEHALYMTFLTETIGSSILVRKDGFIQVAEVDCVNDDNTMDIMWKETGEEVSLPQSDNLLTILEPHDDNLQERILLNLTRCLIQIAEISPKHKATYAKSAALAATLAYVLAEFFDATSDRVTTALLLRAQAQATLQKFAHAQQDLQLILQANADHEQAQKMLRQVQAAHKAAQKREQTLVKEVCKWVETTTGGTNGDAATTEKQRRSKYDKDTTDSAELNGPTNDFWTFFGCSALE